MLLYNLICLGDKHTLSWPKAWINRAVSMVEMELLLSRQVTSLSVWVNISESTGEGVVERTLVGVSVSSSLSSEGLESEEVLLI
jgi:hypothetical protein